MHNSYDENFWDFEMSSFERIGSDSQFRFVW